MDLKTLANSIGVTEEYPEGMDKIYQNLSETKQPACDVNVVKQLEMTYHMFGAFYEDILKAADIINGDFLRSTWVRVASAYAEGVSVADACSIPTPAINGTLANDYLAFFVLLPQLVRGVEEYVCRGFSQEELAELFSNFGESIGIVVQRTGHPGVNQDYYNWLMIFAKARIFMAKGFWIELTRLPASGMWLKNKQTGTLLPLALRGPFCADGKHRVGSAGFETCEDTFEISFEETEEAYIGHGVYDCVVSPKTETFLKSQWDCAGKPKEPCLSFHIPTGADISRENVASVLQLARKTAAERFPDLPCQVVYCASWLLDPTVKELAGEQSRLAAFADSFSRYPPKNNGMSVFGFVFPRYQKDYQKLPENTSLQRKIKQHYIDGKFIYFTPGIYKD